MTVNDQHPTVLATISQRIRVVITTDEETISVVMNEFMADAWLGAILTAGSSWQGMLLSLLEPFDRERIEARMLDGRISNQDVIDAGRAAFQTATGRNWWEAQNIIQVADAGWDEVGGEMTLRGVNPRLVTIGAWVDAAWLVLRRGAASVSKEQLASIESEIRSRPPDAVEDPGDITMDEADFVAAATALQGPIG